LGDILLLRRAVAALRHAGAHVTLLAPTASGEVLLGPGAGDVQRLLPWERAGLARLFSEQGEVPRALRDQLAGFDAALAYTRSDSFARRLAELVPRLVVHDPLPLHGHASDWLAAPLARLGIASHVLLPTPPTTSGEESAVRSFRAALGTGFLALHAGSGSRAKNWPAERYAALVRSFSQGKPWLLVEGPADAEPSAALAGLPGALRARELPVRALGALLAQAGAYIGNDSGISHLAGAWGTPTLALFGPTDPAIWAPLGPRVRVLRSPTGAMDGLEVDDVRAVLSSAS
jgi:hypothetical protein